MTSAFRYDNDARRTLLKRLAGEAYRRSVHAGLRTGERALRELQTGQLERIRSGLISSAMLDHLDAEAVAVAGLTLGLIPWSVEWRWRRRWSSAPWTP